MGLPSQVPFLPGWWSLTPERVGFAFEAGKIGPNGTCFQSDFPEDKSRASAHPFDPAPYITLLEQRAFIGVGAEVIFRQAAPGTKSAFTRHRSVGLAAWQGQQAGVRLPLSLVFGESLYAGRVCQPGALGPGWGPEDSGGV